MGYSPWGHKSRASLSDFQFNSECSTRLDIGQQPRDAKEGSTELHLGASGPAWCPPEDQR